MLTFKASIVLGVILIGVASLFVTFPITPVTGEVPWKDKDNKWYYENLNASQRTKIRQAFDFSIPRQNLIDTLHLGYAKAITSPIGVNFRGVYESSITARPYNPTRALELLTDVFGYEYNSSAAGTDESTKVTSIPYFKITIIAAQTNTMRYIKRWIPYISYSLRQVGINATIKSVLYGKSIIPRIYLDPVDPDGSNYEHGGYDIHFVGYKVSSDPAWQEIYDRNFKISPDPNYKEFYDKNFFPPSSNFYWIEDGPATSGKWTSPSYPNITALWIDIYKESNPNERTKMLKEYQQWCYDHVPTCIIHQENQIWGLDANLQGFDLFHGIQQQICNWTIDGNNTVVIAHSGEYIDFNPLLSQSYYDAIIFSNTHVALARRRGEYNLSHAYPWLAKNWTISTDYKTYTVNLREGNKWSDGTNITADDVVFTYTSLLNTTLAAPGRRDLMNILGNATGTNGKFSCVTKGINDYQVIFTLPKVYAYVETVLFSTEILQQVQMESIDFSNWKSDPTNKGSTPLVASGPYVMHYYSIPDTVELWVNPHYNATAMGHNPITYDLHTGGGNWIPDPTNPGHITNVTFKLVKPYTTAVSGIIAGTYDVIDPQMGIQAAALSINASPNAKILLGYKWGYQELAFNHYSSIFGMNPHDPRDMYLSKPFNFFSEFNLLISNPIIVFLGLFGTLLVTGGFIALLVERSKNGRKSININEN